jgi:hypothetical protein
LLTGQPLKRGDPGFVGLDQIGSTGVVVESAGFVLCDPDPDQIAAQVVPFRQTMQRLASEEFLGDLALERDAVGSMLSCHGSSSENPAPRSIPELPTCPAQGRSKSASVPGRKCASDCASIGSMRTPEFRLGGDIRIAPLSWIRIRQRPR